MISPIRQKKKKKDRENKTFLKMHFKNILYLVHGMKVHGVSSSWVHHFKEKCVYGAGFPRVFPSSMQMAQKWKKKKYM